jgi:hypothetical protein
MLERARGECLRGAAAERGEGSVRPQRSEAGQQVGIGSAGGVGSQARVGTRRISVAFSLVRGTDGPGTASPRAFGRRIPSITDTPRHLLQLFPVRAAAVARGLASA